ncbi:MAG: DUF5009 domain-containing protein [Chitinophagaceae bacterium]
MPTRAVSIDALRGFAILTMVLSGSIAFGGLLPAFMYHAQVPPPLHKFNPTIAGITWVDLVFPFFLFSMGAAIPLALKKKLDAGAHFTVWFRIALKRFVLLAFFALFTQHMKAWVISSNPTTTHYLLSILAFALLFFQLYRPTEKRPPWLWPSIRYVAYAIGIVLLAVLPFHQGKGFDFFKSDIILLVLANMALAGTIVYALTYQNPLLRLGILPFIMAFFLAAKEPNNSFAKVIFEWITIGNYNISWLYKFYFLKYLFILIPGTFAGEWMLAAPTTNIDNTKHNSTILVSALSIIISNVWLLFTRELVLNLIISTILAFVLHHYTKARTLLHRLVQAGTYLLLLGLCFEAYEGGIKKDSSTYSYYFVTSGLAFFALVCFELALRQMWLRKAINYLALNGQNPMIAYVAGALLVTPLLAITNTKAYLDALQMNAWAGLLKGIIFTTLVSLITVFCTQRKWFWRT